MKKTAQKYGRRNVSVILSWYNHDILRGIARFAREAGWSLDLQFTYYSSSTFAVTGDGLISLYSSHALNAGKIRAMAARVPTVDLGWDSESLGLNLHQVVSDNEKIGALAASHFIERGYEHLLFVNIYHGRDEEERMAAFGRAVRKAGRWFHSLVCPDSVLKEADVRRERWLIDGMKSFPKPLAVLSLSDEPALWIMNVCRSAGLHIPEEIAIMGINNDATVCEFAPVPLTSIDVDMERRGFEAASLLDRLMRGKGPSRRLIRIPPTGIVTRKSTEMLAVPSLGVAKALRFIYENYLDPIGVDDVVKATHISRCSLYNAFRQHVGRTVAQEISRVRLNHARKLLKTTDATTFSVALESGFSDAVHLNRTFMRLAGISPTAFRRNRG